MKALRRTAPFAHGSISVGLYLQQELRPPEAIDELRRQAGLADDAGFDGITLSEHHAGFPAYLPSPLQAAGWLLTAMPRAWAAPCPILLPLRAANLVTEELAWLAAAFPGRVGAGLAPGYSTRDFEVAGIPVEERNRRFATGLSLVAAALKGSAAGPVADDPAVAFCAENPVTVLSASAGRLTAARAAKAGAGIMVGSFIGLDESRRAIEAYVAAGGQGPRVLVCRAWVGSLSGDQLRRMGDVYQMRGAQADWWDRREGIDFISGPSPTEIAQRLERAMVGTGATALNVRLFFLECPAVEMREQIEQFGQLVVPLLRAAVPAAVETPLRDQP